MAGPSPSDVTFEIGHVLFIDIVGYSKLMIHEQDKARYTEGNRAENDWPGASPMPQQQRETEIEEEFDREAPRGSIRWHDRQPEQPMWGEPKSCYDRRPIIEE